MPDPLLKVLLLHPTQHSHPIEASDGEDTAAIGDRREVGPYLIHVRKGVPLVGPCQEVVKASHCQAIQVKPEQKSEPGS